MLDELIGLEHPTGLQLDEWNDMKNTVSLHTFAHNP